MEKINRNAVLKKEIALKLLIPGFNAMRNKYPEEFCQKFKLLIENDLKKYDEVSVWTLRALFNKNIII